MLKSVQNATRSLRADRSLLIQADVLTDLTDVTVLIRNNFLEAVHFSVCRFISIYGFFRKDIFMDMSYKTVENEAQDEFVEQRSKFIGYVRPVKTEKEALNFIEEKKKYNWDATHNVYAYIIRNEGIQRCSDDGEPHGTAGVPVLDVMNKSEVTNAVVVMRYFGGILVGAGGLVRAYTRGAKIALEAGGIITMKSCNICHLSCDYNQYGKISGLIPSNGGVIDNTEFGANVTINFHIAPESLNPFERQLADVTCGSVEAEIIEERFFKMKS